MLPIPMVYRIRKKLSRYLVVDRDGRPVGEHGSAQAAKSHLKALRSRAKAPETAAGRRALDDASFVLSQERKFPVTSPQDVKDAVASWGRYRGPTSFETFKRNLIDLARRKGFAAALPKAWTTETKDIVSAAVAANPGHGPGGLFANPALAGGRRLRRRTKAGRYDHIDFTPPAGVRDGARRGLEMRREHGRGGTAVGVARARDLSNGATISPATAKRMHSYFSRHEVDKQGTGFSPGEDGYPSAGKVAWLLWGDDAGAAWARKLVEQMRAADGTATTKAAQTPADPALWEKAMQAAGRRYPSTKSAMALSYAKEWYERRGGAWTDAAAVTTKPGKKYRSIQNPRAYRALRREGYSKEAAARISNAQAPGHTVKAPNYSARAGQTIAGNLARGEDGKFAPASGSGSKPAKTKPTKAKPAKPADPDKERAREYRETRRAQILADREERRARQAQREAERQADRQQRLADREERRRERADRRAEQERRRQEREEKKPKGGGGGGSGKKGDDAKGEDSLDRSIAALRDIASLFRRGKAAEPSTFAVFKDARGAWRWLAQTTTAFEDRDREVISTKALADDVARADADGRYGPLRWWHIGTPDPQDADAPWGPGLDLGWCDFNAISGKTLVESGTFKTEAIARWAAANADKLGLSPGFFHPATEPDRSGVFHHIRRFERSIAPKERVSNPFTAFHITRTTRKETPSVDTAKIKTLLDLGLDSATIKSLLDGVETTEKTAQQAGVRFKTEDPRAAQIAAIEDQLAALKAAMAEEEKAPGDETLLEAAEDEAEGMEHADAEMDEELIDMKLTAFMQKVGDLIDSKLAPLMAQLKMSEKMEGMLKGIGEEMKAMYGGTAKKEASTAAAITETAATLKTAQDEIATLKARIAELEAGRTALQQGHRASADDASVTAKATNLAEASQPQPLSDLEETLSWASRTASGAFGAAPPPVAVPFTQDANGFIGQPATRR